MIDDEPVVVTPDVRLTVERLQALKKVSGLSFSECMAADDEVRLRAVAFLELYRRDRSPGLGQTVGPVPDPGDLWERAGRVEIYFSAPERPDPTREGP